LQPAPFSLHQLWAPKQDPNFAVLMAWPAHHLILSRVVAIAQKGYAEGVWNNLLQKLRRENQAWYLAAAAGNAAVEVAPPKISTPIEYR
jgi:hypothetical protein